MNQPIKPAEPSDFAEQMAVAREVARRRRVALHQLAKSGSSAD